MLVLLDDDDDGDGDDDDEPETQEILELVCQRWHAIMLLMPGVISRLWIRRATKKEAVQAFIQRRKTRFAVVVM